MDQQTIDSMVGRKFGKLTVTEYTGALINKRSKRERDFWKCKCECGTMLYLPTAKLVSGNRTSCGCFHSGFSKHPLHSVWTNMKTRCHNPKAHNYKYYGGKGVKVCDEWRNNYFLFYKWAIENGYDEEHKKDSQLDRIDSNGDYCPENCRFVNRYVQANNKSNNVRILFRGEMLTHREIYDKYCNMNYHTFINRIYMGWDIEDAVTLPINKNGRKHKSSRLQEY